MSKLRWGILGTGNIANQFAAGVAAGDRGVLTAVGSRTLSAATAFCKTHRADALAGSYADVLASAACDAVYISLPNTMHHEWCLAALAAGKHVLCEKPITMNYHEAAEVFDTAERAGRLVIEAFMYRAHPQTQKLVELLSGNVIGAIKSVRTSFCFHARKQTGNIRFDADLGGGALLDVGCYCVNFSRLIAGGEPTAMHAVGLPHGSGVDEQVTGVLNFENGVQASFVVGMGMQADNATQICGSEGFIQIPVPWKPLPGGGEIIVAKGVPPKQDGIVVPPPPPEVHRIDDGRALYGIEADAFAACVLDGAPPFVTAADSLGNMKVLDTLRRQVSADADL